MRDVVEELAAFVLAFAFVRDVLEQQGRLAAVGLVLGVDRHHPDRRGRGVQLRDLVDGDAAAGREVGQILGHEVRQPLAFQPAFG